MGVNWSIRRFLFLSLMLSVSGAGLVATWSVYLQAYHEVEELFDAQLVQNGRLLAVLLGSDEVRLDPLVLPRVGAGHKYERFVALQRYAADGELLLTSPSMPAEALAPFEPGLSSRHHGGKQWYVYTQRMPDGGWLLVGEEEHVRVELAREVARVMAAPYLLFVPLILLFVWLALRRGLRPLERLTEALAERDDRNLAALPVQSDVAEIRPLVRALNDLLQRLEKALAREQRFTADAAHELRTLLAVLKLHAENARSLADEGERNLSLSRLQAGVDRATRMVTQLLAMARLDPEPGQVARGSLLAAPVCRQVLADLTPLADERGQLLAPDLDEQVRVTLSEEMLTMLVRNLVENALRYGPAQATVALQLTQEPEVVVLTVADEGEGVPADLADRVCERFYRGHHDAPGAGLGLSIVRRIVELAGGSLVFRQRSDAGTAAVEARLPMAGANRLTGIPP